MRPQRDYRGASVGRIGLVVGLVGVVCGVIAVVLGLLPVSIDQPERPSYDCGAPAARLGGDSRERKWQRDSFIANTDEPQVPADQLPQAACRQSTDDRLEPAMLLAVLAIVGVLAAAVLLWLARRPTSAVDEDEDVSR